MAPGQAHGLCFSVPARGPAAAEPRSTSTRSWRPTSASRRARHGFLEHWAKQGVLLLNSVLTVEMGRAASHRDRGWERFTDAIIRRGQRAGPSRSCSCCGAATRRRRRRSSTPPRHSGAEGARTLRRCRRTAASSAAAISPRPTRSSKAQACRRSTGRCRNARPPRRSAADGHAAISARPAACPLRPKRRCSTMCRTRGPARSTSCASPRPSSPRCAR